ncbi:MAG TPA: L-threonylcarbamoyladenylate synthase [Candidatus Competibacter sp.]|jgi:tRNA threonylcarbamoyl adenosine modification protein (Sua5/YciO/YrdC/YwlC family)|nr:threonylcarbamoyl-AMP synthase [Candidatus Competibacter sp.]MCC9001161.1 threonylcarbamoyl-AMP synthase [Candidatus Competibacter sp.]MCC9004486.1 threonylcarbamoyl-AMP synthase [Candidatus Competibacter sp.]HRF63304.1 L-threonylcarbamoyladenylate synthase [Candidatus Competibacter sp.]HRX62135.1 L-threonylcarbamoyladenylate synthase [Candidatus Competibacter sp.]
MSRFIQIHPLNPQPRLIAQAVEQLSAGAVIVYPTDSSYALGCRLGDKTAAERIRHIRQTDRHHNFTLVCRDLSEIATYAKVDNRRYRLLKTATPGPFTFILQATHEVPRRLQHPRRKTIGIRIPDTAIVRALLAALGEPIMSCTLTLPGDDWPLADPQEIEERLRNDVDLIIDGGPCQQEPTTVLDLTEDAPQLIRQGLGDAGPFL